MRCARCGSETDALPCSQCGEEPRLDGRFRLLALLGRGAHGSTWRAVDDLTGQARAIKELPLRLGTPDKVVALFRREAEVLGQIDHPGVPRLHEVLETGRGRSRTLWLVLELIEGESLEARLRSHRFSVEEVLEAVRGIARVLDWLHRRSPPIVHRDVKPANVLQTPEGRWVLVDFGAVRDALRDEDLGGSTVAGTFGYMAPEQFAGDAGPRSDVYGLGALAVALLTRQEPRTLQGATGRMDWHPHARPPAPVTALLDRMLSPERQDRPDARQVITAIDGLLEGGLAETAPEPTEPGPSADLPAAPGPPGEAVPMVADGTSLAPEVDGTRIRLGTMARRAPDPKDATDLADLLEHLLDMPGRGVWSGGSYRWRSSPLASNRRRVQVSIVPTGQGASVRVSEDLQGFLGGMYGGLIGGIGGGVGGGVGWLSFAEGGVLSGLTFVALVLVGAYSVATAGVRHAKRQRLAELDHALDGLEEHLGGAVRARPDVLLPPAPGPAMIGGGLAFAMAVVVILGATGVLGVGLPWWIVFAFVFVFVGGRKKRRHLQHERDRVRRPRALPGPRDDGWERWELEDLDADEERVRGKGGRHKG